MYYSNILRLTSFATLFTDMKKKIIPYSNLRYVNDLIQAMMIDRTLLWCSNMMIYHTNDDISYIVHMMIYHTFKMQAMVTYHTFLWCCKLVLFVRVVF